MAKWKVPANVQRWLVDNMLPSDDNKLSDYNIGKGPFHPDPVIYLYLLSARTAAVFDKQKQTRERQGTFLLFAN